jgi:hypothetical protein
MDKKQIITGIVGVLLAGTSATSLIGWQAERQRVKELEDIVSELEQQEKRSAIDRSVSSQMEEIAFEQKIISDEQRENALQQTRVANEMRERSEIERQNAIAAERSAVASEKKALEASALAENQRQIAEHQRIQAELSKRIADTLSYVALARSLGSLSSTQAQLGNTELADLLAYSSYHFINRYRGDVYTPAIFQSLTTASQSIRSWPKHNGALMKSAFMSEKDNRMITVSSYGQIMSHKKVGEELQSQILLSDNIYDFRDLIIENEVIYAISRSGYLVILDHGNTSVLPLPNLDFPMHITTIDNNNLLLVGDHGIAQYDKQRKMVVNTCEFDYKITCVSRYDNHPLLFDDKERQHLVKDFHNLETSNVSFKGRVTAFASSKSSKQRVYGMSDGTIYLYNERTGKTTKLEGHLSRISKLKLDRMSLYSSSYDGTLKLWNTGSEKIEPITLVSTNSWIMDFNFDSSKQYAWIGDQNGYLSEVLMSVPMMVEKINKKLTRNFTPEEWNYYIGKNVPYETFKK